MARHPRARRPRLLVLGAGPAQLGFLRTARERDAEVIAVDHDPAAVGFPLADKRALVSIEDEPAVERLARAEDVDGIVAPGTDWPVGVAARIAERMGLPHPIDATTAGLATNKQRQRTRLAEAGIRQPAARVVTGMEEGLPVPCVVKAPDRQGQRGLSLVLSDDQLPAAIEEAISASRNGLALVEELADGPEVTVNAVAVDDTFALLTVTDRVTADPPAFGVALAHVWPSEHDVDDAYVEACSAASRLGVRDGPVYVQVRLAASGPQIVEVATRLGGGHDAELCKAATGIDLNGLAFDFALGEAVSVPEPAHAKAGGACVVFLVAPEGELREVHGVEDAEAVEGVEWVQVYRRPGHRFGPLRRGPDRAGAVLAVGESREQALERARRAADAVRFQVDADAP